MSDKLYIMSKDSVTAVYENNKLEIINYTLLPYFLKNHSDLNLWLETRAVDAHRPNSRLIKKVLRLNQFDDIATVLHSNAATITDCFWVKKADSNLTYSDIRFKSDYFSELALNGTYDSMNYAYENKEHFTPELTNRGSFEKCWKLIDNKWYILKKATKEEQYSEIFVSKLGKALNIPMADYTAKKDYVLSADFTNSASVNFIHAYDFMLDNEDYDDVAEKLEIICPKAIKNYVKMLFLDTICSNPDRHTNNFGLIQNCETGELIDLAPCFDHNMALISRGYPKKSFNNDLFIEFFVRFINNHAEYQEYIPEIDNKTIEEIAYSIDIDVDKRFVSEYVTEKYHALLSALDVNNKLDLTQSNSKGR